VPGGGLGQMVPRPAGDRPGTEGGRHVRRAVAGDIACPDRRVQMEPRHPLPGAEANDRAVHGHAEGVVARFLDPGRQHVEGQ